MKINFDQETCGRCGGTGRYSFNLADGDRCYGCSGAGKKLTRAGRKAYDAFEAALTIPAKDVVVGDIVNVKFLTITRRRRVLSIGPSESRSWSITNGERVENPPYIRFKYKDVQDDLFPDSPVRLAFTPDKRDRVLIALKGMKGYSVTETAVATAV